MINLQNNLLIDVNSLKNLLKVASPQQKIQRFKLADPFVQNFVFNFENLIDWNSVRSEQDINTQITGKIDELVSKKDSALLQDIDLKREENILEERLLADPNDHEASQALNYYRSNPQAAKTRILEEKNKERTKIINEWINYLTQTNYPTPFKYIVLKSILTVPKGEIDPPPSLNQEVLNYVLEDIKKNPNRPINFNKLYYQFGVNSISKNREVIEDERGGKWVKIPSKIEDPENFEKNVKDLMNLSQGSGWCVAGEEMATDYLSRGDFWIYYHQIKDKQKAKIAIRLIGDKQIKEIRGDMPGQGIELGYETIADEFLKQKKFVGGEEYKKKLEEQKKNKEFVNQLVVKINSGIKLSEEEIEFSTKNINIAIYLAKKTRIPPEIIKGISKSSDYSYKFAQGLKFDITKIPPEMINKINGHSKWAYKFQEEIKKRQKQPTQPASTQQPAQQPTEQSKQPVLACNWYKKATKERNPPCWK